MKVIYIITNIINQNCYIGSAKDFRLRKNCHFSNLSLNKHPNIHLQRAYNKYGIDSFIINILERIDKLEDLTIREQYYIDLLKPNYNINVLATNWLYKKHKQSSKDKMRKAKLGKKFSKETRFKMSEKRKEIKYIQSDKDKLKMSENRDKPIIQLNMNEDPIKIWKNAALAGRELGLDYRALQRMARGKMKKSKLCGGYKWKYE